MCPPGRSPRVGCRDEAPRARQEVLSVDCYRGRFASTKGDRRLRKTWLVGSFLALILGVSACGGSEQEAGDAPGEAASANSPGEDAPSGAEPDLSGVPAVVAEVNGEEIPREDFAVAYEGQLQQAQLDRERTSAQLEHASLASQQALKARDNYVLNMKKRSAEAMQLISAAKQAKLQEQLAQTMETFNIGDDASTFNEMREKIDRRVAAAEAKLQLGSSTVDAQMADIEREAMDIQLHDKLLEYKQQMGLLGAGGGNASGKQITAGEEAAPEAESDADVIDAESTEASTHN